MRASTTTSLIDGIAPWWPVTRVSQPRRPGAVLPDDEVGRRCRVACGTCWRAVGARPLARLGSVDARSTLWVWATDVLRIWPSESVTTTKSPPTTGRPCRCARTARTGCRATRTGLAWKASCALIFSAGALLAISRWRNWAASGPGVLRRSGAGRRRVRAVGDRGEHRSHQRGGSEAAEMTPAHAFSWIGPGRAQTDGRGVGGVIQTGPAAARSRHLREGRCADSPPDEGGQRVRNSGLCIART